MSPDALLLSLAILAGGLAVWGLAAWRIWHRQPVLEQAPRQEASWWFVPLVAVGLFVGFQLVNRVLSEWKLLEGDRSESAWSIDAVRNASVVNLLLVGVLLFLVSEGGRRKLSDFGVHWKRPADDAAVGGLGFLASFPPVLIVFLLTSPLQSEERTHPLVRMALENPTFEAYFWIAVAVLIAAPLAEELVFRVILQGWLRTKLPAYAAIGISSILFAAVHGFPDALALLPLALILGYVFEKRQSWLAVAVLHMLFNARTLAAILLGEPASP